VNLFHRWYCKSKGWADAMQKYILPWALGDAQLGDNVLEIGPGPGVVTDWLRPRVPHVTSVEIDHKLAAALRQRFEGTNVTVIEGDATALELADNSFSSAVCFTMLHHVPSASLQDRLLSEACRVLQPGGALIGSDSTPTLMWNIYHVFDTRTPVDPDTFGERLERAGFAEVSVQRPPGGRSGFSFSAQKPA
jgi:ubiquinone/menaquinone biosynthesis C-methylase UbiE